MPKLDGVRKATGGARYIDDISIPGTLKGKILPSPLPHARILNIDTSRAERLPGVKAVITAKDLPPTRVGIFIKDMPVMAWGKVRFIGEPVAAVAAIDDDTAYEAVRLIDVEYEELPAVFDPEVAMEAGAPLIHEELESYFATFLVRRFGNVCSHTTFNWGDVEEGFKEADYIFEDTFTTPIVHQGYIEPTGVLVQVDISGKVTAYASTQSPHLCQIRICEGLQIPISKIRVIAAQLGGGFGGKEDLFLLSIAIALSQKAGRPVKMVLSREEEFSMTRPRHPSRVTIKSGVKRDGSIIARQARLIMATGAYSDQGPGVTSVATRSLAGPYRIPHVRLDGYCIYTNLPVCGAYRGYGNPQATFAVESHMDMIAERLGIDPLEFRLKNALDVGDLSPDGHPLHSVGLKECLEKVAKASDWSAPPLGGSGRGLAVMQHISAVLSSSTIVRINEDGTATLSVGAVDLGTGSETILCQMVAEELGLPLSDISIVMGDTDATPYNWSTAASRTTYVTGHAVKSAASDARRQVLELAGEALEAHPEDLTVEEGRVFVKGTPERGMTMRQVDLLSHWKRGGPIIGKASFMVQGPPPDPKRVMGDPFGFHAGWTFAAQVAEVAVDRATGEVRVKRAWAAHDVGRAINPTNVEGQVQGAFAQGLGYALFEKVHIEGGKVINPSLMDYRLPAAPDVPQIDVTIVEATDETGPFGAKGVGEPGLVPSAPAIANALYRAVGVRIKELPITPEAVLKAIKEKGGGSALKT